MHGQERDITIPLQLLGVGKGPNGKVRMGMLGKFKLRRSEFGMNRLMEAIGDEVAVTFSFQAIRE
jgi:polyisoprenoid-binding protein YceI